MKTYQAGITGFVLGLAVAAGTMLWHRGAPAVEGAPAPAVANLTKETVPVKSVQAYVSSAKKKLNLPKDVQADPTAHVTGATTVTCDERDKTVSSVLSDDGSTRMFVKAEPLPWFRQEEINTFSLDYGRKRGVDKPVLMGGLRADLLQTKAVHWGGTVLGDTDGGYFYGVGARVTFR